VVRPTRPPTRAPTATLTMWIISTTLPAVTDTAVPSPTSAPGNTPKPTKAPKKTAAPAATQPAKPAPTAQPAFQFRAVATRPDPNRGGCCLIFGTVRDAQGNALEGVLVRASNQWR